MPETPEISAEIASKMTADKNLPFAVIGSGLVGLTAALCVAQTGFAVKICAPAINNSDGRSTALLSGSVGFLKKLGIWPDLQATAFPLKTMRMIDDTRRLIRAPQTDFICSEIGLDAFGYNVLNIDLTAQLMKQLKQLDNVEFVEKSVATIDHGGAKPVIRFAGGQSLTAEFIIAADGRNSPTRKSMGVAVRKWSYPQTALVANFSHTLPHHDISTEFHTETGPFTLVPLGENCSSLVCVETAPGAATLMAFGKAALEREIEHRCHSILGKMQLKSKLQCFPLTGLISSIFGKKRTVLMGEAAHLFPPIGAQGFNLGIRDVETLGQLLEKHRFGEIDRVAEAYSRARLVDTNTRTLSVDMLNRSLLSNFLPVQMLRSAGLYTVGAFSPLRKLLMREGMQPGSGFTGLAKSPFRRRPAARP